MDYGLDIFYQEKQMKRKDARPSNFHSLEPDFRRPLYRLREDIRSRMFSMLVQLYGETKSRRYIKELERVISVYHAHKTDEMMEWESHFKPEDRFTNEDAILITYGNLVVDKHKKPLKTLDEMSHKYLRRVFNTIHILPFFPSSSDRGFAISDYRQVDPDLGTWEDIIDLKKDFRLMFDGVINHVSSKSFWFQEFLNGNPAYQGYFTHFPERRNVPRKKLNKLMRPRTSEVLTPFYSYNGKRLVWTTFSADQIDLKFQNPMVLIKIIEILLYYVRRGADIIRLDAVTYLWDELGTTGAHLSQTHTIIKLFRLILDAVVPHVAIVTETNVPHSDNITYFGSGYDEAQLVYNFALPPLILHTFHNSTSAKLTQWARELKNPSRYATYLNFLDSHDGIGVLGAREFLTDEDIELMAERVTQRGGLISYRTDKDGKESIYELNITFYSALNCEDACEEVDFQVNRYIAARSIPLVIIGVPGVYLHGLLGSKNDIEAVKKENDKRSINRDVLSREELEKAMEDFSTTTAQVAHRLSFLIQKRTREKAFHPQGGQSILTVSDAVFAVLRTSPDGDEHILAITSVIPKNQQVKISLAEFIIHRKWVDILTGDEYFIANNVFTLNLEPYEVLWLKMQV